MQKYDFDAIVIGSGFGGSVMTCRLAEKGYRVCLLERGKQYGMNEFPRRIDDVKNNLFWDPEDKMHGFMEISSYSGSDALSVRASGLGGGSLIYANVLLRVPEPFFEGWPGGISRKELDPYYDRGVEMLEGSPYPLDKDHPFYNDTSKSHKMKEASDKIDDSEDATKPHRFFLPDLAIRFKGDFPGHQTPNNQGVLQSSCTKCGECDIGCNIHAKNTLDLNYLARAQNAKRMGSGSQAAEVRTHAEVIAIEAIEEGGYRVTYRNPINLNEITQITSEKVVVSAGSIGSTALLLKMKKTGQLKNLSDMLGEKWCGNGDLEGTALSCDDDIELTNGPVITTAVEYHFKPYPDGFQHGLLLQDAGLPSFLIWYVVGKLPSPYFFVRVVKMFFGSIMDILKKIANALRLYKFRSEINLGDDIAGMIDRDNYVRKTMLLLGMGRDRNDGRIELRDDGKAIIKYNWKNSKLHYDRTRREMKKIAKALGGKFMDNPLSYLHKMIAVHPIGGCAMAESAQEGVVDTNGEAFGHKGLYVVDASIFPSSVGWNPSLTITAMAERIADKIPKKK